MKVKLRTIMAGPEFRGGPGDVIDVPKKMGDDLVLGGYASLVEDTPDVTEMETAQAPDAPEAAVERRPRRGRP